MTDQFVVHMALNSLPTKYKQLKVSYNTEKEKWGIYQLILMCAQEEDRLKGDKLTEVNFVQVEKGNKFTNAGSSFIAGKLKKKAISSSVKNTNASKGSHKLKHVNTEIKKEKECYLCKETGRSRRNYVGFKNWHSRECKFFNVFVCVKSNLVYIPPKS